MYVSYIGIFGNYFAIFMPLMVLKMVLALYIAMFPDPFSEKIPFVSLETPCAPYGHLSSALKRKNDPISAFG